MVKLFADSTNDLSEDIIKECNITIIPLYISLGDKTGKDGVDIRPDDIYRWADNSHDTPKTAAFSPADAIEVMRECKDAGDDIIFIGISENMSTTCNVVRIAAEELEYSDRVYSVNSKNLSTGIGLVILHAADMISKGMSASDIVKELDEIIPRVRASFVVDTLTYLHRGGRCSAVTALLANTLKLKPKIVVTDGKMDVSSKYRGRLSQVIIKYVEDMKDKLLNSEKNIVFITHSGVDKEIVDTVRTYLSGLNHFDKIVETRAGGVVSSHCGPGTLGVLFIENN